MDRRAFIGSLALATLTPPRVSPARPARKVRRIGILGLGVNADLVGPQPRSPSVRALLSGLRELGYVYGEHFVTEPRGADSRPELTDPLTLRHRTRIVELASTHRLPAMYTFAEFAQAGGLMAYGPSVREMFRRAATHVDRILKGTAVANLPVEQPTTFELVVNLKTARALELTIPPPILLRANEVIQ